MDLATQERWARAGALAWCVALAAGLPAWWAAMVFVPASRALFVPASMGDAAVWSFALGDLTLLWMPTVWSAVQLRRDLGQARASAWVVTGALAYSAAWSLLATLWTGEAPLGPPLMLLGAGVQASVAWTMQPVEQWFRVSGATTPAARVARTVAHAALFDGLFLVVLPAWLHVAEDWAGVQRFDLGLWWPCLAAVVALNLGGLFAGCWMAVVGRGTPLPVDTAAELVVTGPYAHLRNPMAALGVVQGALLGVGLGSWATVAYAACGVAVWHLFVRPVEEADLQRRFGAAYDAYHANVPLWVPRLRPWRPLSAPAPRTSSPPPPAP